MAETKIRLYDLDGTIINSSKMIVEHYVSALQNATGKPHPELRKRFIETSLNQMLKEEGIKSEDFFANHFTPLDFRAEMEKGTIAVFPDAKKALERARTGINLLITNSSERATNQKLECFGLEGYFRQVFSEFVPGKAKPSVYMGDMALRFLHENNMLVGYPKIYVIGDMINDIEFGVALKELYPDTKVVYIKRKQNPQVEFNGKIKPDFTISSLLKLFDI